MTPERELVDLLMRAEVEINQLRRRNEILEAVNRVIETFSTALFAQPSTQGAAVDIAWELRKAADKLAGTAPVQS